MITVLITKYFDAQKWIRAFEHRNRRGTLDRATTKEALEQSQEGEARTTGGISDSERTVEVNNASDACSIRPISGLNKPLKTNVDASCYAQRTRIVDDASCVAELKKILKQNADQAEEVAAMVKGLEDERVRMKEALKEKADEAEIFSARVQGLEDEKVMMEEALKVQKHEAEQSAATINGLEKEKVDMSIALEKRPRQRRRGRKKKRGTGQGATAAAVAGVETERGEEESADEFDDGRSAGEEEGASATR